VQLCSFTPRAAVGAPESTPRALRSHSTLAGERLQKLGVSLCSVGPPAPDDDGTSGATSGLSVGRALAAEIQHILDRRSRLRAHADQSTAARLRALSRDLLPQRRHVPRVFNATYTALHDARCVLCGRLSLPCTLLLSNLSRCKRHFNVYVYPATALHLEALLGQTIQGSVRSPTH
jgi:hypothetical protein